MKFRCLLIAVIFLAGCDAVQPQDTSLLVVEAFVMSEQSLPEIILRQAAPLQDPYQLDSSTAAMGAQVGLTLQDALIPYRMQRPGAYVPLDSVIAVPGESIALNVQWEDQLVTARTRIPPLISLDSIEISVSDTPVPGLLLDSLFIDPTQIDSLGIRALGTGAREGLVHLVRATVYWEDHTGNDGNDWWIRMQLLPTLTQDQRLSNYFLSSEVVQPEEDIPFIDANRRSWSGSYAVPVASQTDPISQHGLRISIIRCTEAYADFVSQSSNPGEYEPPSNILHGRGIFAGLAVDTFTVSIK